MKAMFMTDEKAGEIEARVSSLEKSSDAKWKKLDEMMSLIHEIRSDVKVLRMSPICPNPGACNKLEPMVVEIEKRLRELEQEAQRIMGGKTIVVALCMLVGWAVTALIEWYHK